MSRRPRRNHTPAFKAKVALGRHQGRRRRWPSWRSSSTSIPIRSRRGRRSSRAGQRMFSVRRRQRSGAAGGRREVAACQDRRADAGERFFGRSARQSRSAERKAMIDRAHDLPIARQAEALSISRGSVYYLPRPVPEADLAIMRRIDETASGVPVRRAAGCCAICWLARGARSAVVTCKTLMRRMGIEALYRRPHTSKPEPGHKIYPYLLRGLAIARPNQVWAMDITYIPMARGFVYLAVVLDWFSRRVLSWRLSITMEVDFCVETLEEALARHGKPEIFNTDQGSQFTGAAFTGVLLDNGDRHQHGRQGRLAGQRLRRAAVASRSNTRRCICEPTTASARPALRSAAIWTSTMAADRIRALTAPHPIKPTSTRCQSAWRPNPGRRSTYRRGKSVQTTGATSVCGQ